jgi:hypothetical protein
VDYKRVPPILQSIQKVRGKANNPNRFRPGDLEAGNIIPTEYLKRILKYKKFVGKQQVTMTKYSHNLVRIKSTITTFVACLLPTAAIAILSSIYEKGKLIRSFAGLTALFAMGLMVFTSTMPLRVEIFSATAA